MKYKDLKVAIANNEKLPDYYTQLLVNAESILLDMGINGQNKVAKELGLSQTKLSHIKELLIASLTYPKDSPDESN